jgi:hypothetical protein
MAVDRAWVIAKVTENVQRAMQVEPVQDREGNPTGQYIYHGGVANRATELLGKELGMFQPRPEKDQGLERHESMARMNAGRDRVAKEKRERDAAAADSTNLLRRDPNIRELSAPKRRSAVPSQSGTWPLSAVSSVRLLNLSRGNVEPAVYLTKFSRSPRRLLPMSGIRTSINDVKRLPP